MQKPCIFWGICPLKKALALAYGAFLQSLNQYTLHSFNAPELKTLVDSLGKPPLAPSNPPVQD
jgi:hypothetical protein